MGGKNHGLTVEIGRVARRSVGGATPVVVAVGGPSAATLFDGLRADTALGNKAALADTAVTETAEAQPAEVELGEVAPEPDEPPQSPESEPPTVSNPPPGGGSPGGGGGGAGGLGLGGLAGIAGLAVGIAALASDDDNPTPASPN